MNRGLNFGAELGKIPPQAIEVESAILGACMSFRDTVDVVLSILPKELETFYKEEHAVIYEVILDLYKNSQPIDILTVTAKLNENGKIDIAGGPYGVTKHTIKVNSGANAEEHCRIIMQKYFARIVIKANTDSIGKLFDGGDVFEILEREYTKLMYIQTFLDKKAIKSLPVIVDENLEKTKSAMTLPDHITGIPTGFKILNDITAGWQNSDLIILAARPAMGKLQPLTEPVLTPNGWKKMGEIKIGSEILCPIDAIPKTVLDVYPQNNLKIYKITFNDGTWTECCNEHLWKIQTQTDIKNNRSRVVDVDWMIKTRVLDTRNKSRFRIPLINGVEFSKQEIDLDPYLLGLFIGNGSMSSKYQNCITNHSDVSQEIFNRIKDIVPNDISIRLDKEYGGSKCRRIIFNSLIRKYFGELLDKKSRTKFIPKNYLYNSVKVRKELLRGLMDSDGSCLVFKNSKIATYSTMSVQLKDDIIELARSLGGKASAASETREKYKNNGRCWNIAIKTPFNPFNLSYKKERFELFPYKETFTKTIRSIEYMRRDRGQCIMVNSKHHLYITRDYTVTHNSSMALKMAKSAALKGFKVVFFSLEMSENQLVVRLQSAEAGISLERINSGRIDQSEFINLENQSQSIKKLPLTIIDRSSLTVLEIKAECNRIRKESGLDIVFVDYLQLMSGEGQNREAVVSGISRGLKGMAKGLDVPVVALSQLSRAVETRGGTKRPQLSDLREGGAIEADADMVLFLYRAEYYGILEDQDGNSLLEAAEIIIAKNRQGRLGSIMLQFIAKYVKFLDPQSTFGETSDRNQQLQEDYKGKSPDKEDNWFDK